MTDPFDRLPRPFVEAVLSGRLSGVDLRVWLECWRQSDGWGAGREHTETWCSSAALSSRLGIAERSVRRSLSVLLDCGALVVAVRAYGPVPAAYRVDARALLSLPTPDTQTRGLAVRGDTQTPGTPDTQTRGTPDTSARTYENKDENKDEYQQQQPRARGWSLAERGPQPPRVETPAYDGDVSAAVERVCRAMTRPDQQGVVRRPTAMQEQHVAMAMLEVGVERVEAIARLCAAEAWGIGGLLRCFDADGRELPDKLPGAKREAVGGKQARSDEPEWARIKRERQEATERYDEIWRQVDARPDRMPTEDEEAELERLAAPMRRFA